MVGRVAVVGSFNVDHVWVAASLPRPGETLAGTYRSGPGGKGFNQAVAAVRAGAATDFVCALGDDAGGVLARALASDDGIALHALDSDAPTGTAGIFVGEGGGNSIVIGPGANAALTPAFVDAHSAVLEQAAVVVAQLESPLEAIARALRIARDAGVTTVLNPAPANVAVPGDLLALVDVLTPNETEFASLLRAHAGERLDAGAIAALDDAALHALCRRLLPLGTVVVTLAAAGCFVSHADSALRGDRGVHARVTGESACAVDTTGAGDAFNGALAGSVAIAPQRPFVAHLRFANRFAALSTERSGAASAMPHADEVATRFGP